MQQVSNRKEVTRWLIMALDLFLLNVVYQTLIHYHQVSPDSYGILSWNIAYILSIARFMPIAQNRLSKSEVIIKRVLATSFSITFLFFIEVSVIEHLLARWQPLAVVFCVIVLSLFFSRFLGRAIIKTIRSHGKDKKDVIFVGAGVNLRALYDRIATDITTGYNVHGYFESQDSRNLGNVLPRLGTVQQLIPYLEAHPVDMLFCNLPQENAEDIRTIMDYCENHLIHFYSVPNVRNYVHRAMTVEFVDDIPVLSVHYEPLRKPLNRIIKRTFDIYSPHCSYCSFSGGYLPLFPSSHGSQCQDLYSSVRNEMVFTVKNSPA